MGSTRANSPVGRRMQTEGRDPTRSCGRWETTSRPSRLVHFRPQLLTCSLASRPENLKFPEFRPSCSLAHLAAPRGVGFPTCPRFQVSPNSPAVRPALARKPNHDGNAPMAISTCSLPSPVAHLLTCLPPENHKFLEFRPSCSLAHLVATRGAGFPAGPRFLRVILPPGPAQIVNFSK